MDSSMKQKQYPKTPLQRQFAQLEKAGLKVVLSGMAQNAVQFEASPDKKIALYERIRRHQPEFVEGVVAIVGW